MPTPLPPSWQCGHDGSRWIYVFRPTGHVQYHFPCEGDELSGAAAPPPIELAPGGRPESQQQVRQRPTEERSDGQEPDSSKSEDGTVEKDEQEDEGGRHHAVEDNPCRPEHLEPDRIAGAGPLDWEDPAESGRIMFGFIESPALPAGWVYPLPSSAGRQANATSTPSASTPTIMTPSASTSSAMTPSATTPNAATRSAVTSTRPADTAAAAAENRQMSATENRERWAAASGAEEMAELPETVTSALDWESDARPVVRLPTMTPTPAADSQTAAYPVCSSPETTSEPSFPVSCPLAVREETAAAYVVAYRNERLAQGDEFAASQAPASSSASASAPAPARPDLSSSERQRPFDFARVHAELATTETAWIHLKEHLDPALHPEITNSSVGAQIERKTSFAMARLIKKNGNPGSARIEGLDGSVSVAAFKASDSATATMNGAAADASSVPDPIRKSENLALAPQTRIVFGFIEEPAGGGMAAEGQDDPRRTPASHRLADNGSGQVGARLKPRQLAQSSTAPEVVVPQPTLPPEGQQQQPQEPQPPPLSVALMPTAAVCESVPPHQMIPPPGLSADQAASTPAISPAVLGTPTHEGSLLLGRAAPDSVSPSSVPAVLSPPSVPPKMPLTPTGFRFQATAAPFVGTSPATLRPAGPPIPARMPANLPSRDQEDGQYSASRGSSLPVAVPPPPHQRLASLPYPEDDQPVILLAGQHQHQHHYHHSHSQIPIMPAVHRMGTVPTEGYHGQGMHGSQKQEQQQQQPLPSEYTLPPPPRDQLPRQFYPTYGIPEWAGQGQRRMAPIPGQPQLSQQQQQRPRSYYNFFSSQNSQLLADQSSQPQQPAQPQHYDPVQHVPQDSAAATFRERRQTVSTIGYGTSLWDQQQRQLHQQPQQQYSQYPQISQAYSSHQHHHHGYQDPRRPDSYRPGSVVPMSTRPADAPETLSAASYHSIPPQPPPADPTWHFGGGPGQEISSVYQQQQQMLPLVSGRPSTTATGYNDNPPGATGSSLPSFSSSPERRIGRAMSGSGGGSGGADFSPKSLLRRLTDSDANTAEAAAGRRYSTSVEKLIHLVRRGSIKENQPVPSPPLQPRLPICIDKHPAQSPADPFSGGNPRRNSYGASSSLGRLMNQPISRSGTLVEHQQQEIQHSQPTAAAGKPLPPLAMSASFREKRGWKSWLNKTGNKATSMGQSAESSTTPPPPPPPPKTTTTMQQDPYGRSQAGSTMAEVSNTSLSSQHPIRSHQHRSSSIGTDGLRSHPVFPADCESSDEEPAAGGTALDW